MSPPDGAGAGHSLTELVSRLPGAVYRSTVDFPWTMEFISDGSMALTGYSPAEFEGGARRWADLIHSDDLPWVEAEISFAVARGTPFSLIYRITHRDGEERWVHERGHAIRDAAGCPVTLEGFISDTTDRKLAEQRLLESEAHYRYRVELDPQTTWAVDAEGRMIEISGRWTEYTGLPREAALGSGWLQVVHPDDLAERVGQLQEARLTGTPADFRVRLRRSDGEYRWFRARSFPRYDDRGHIVRRYGYSEDIHEQVLAEERLRESEENYRHRVELSPQVPWTADADGNIIEVSSHLIELTGMSHEDALGTGWLQWVHPDDVPPTVRTMQQVIASGRPADFMFRYRLRDGSYHWFRARGFPRRDADGRVVKWYGMSEDVHDRILAEQALLRSEAELATIFDQALVGMAYVSPDDGMLRVNDRLAAILGRSPQELIGQRFQEITYPDDVELSAELFDRNHETGTPYAVEKRYLRPDGTHVWCRVHVSFVDGDYARAIVVIDDISERKAAEIELQRLQDELIYISRVSAMGTMASALAHEINQPLAAAASFVQGSARLLMAQDFAGRDEILDAIDKGAAQMLRAGEIIRRLRALVAKREAKREPVDLATLIEETRPLAMLGARARSMTTATMLDPSARIAVGDRVQIQQVLINLVRNAVDAMAESGRRELAIATRKRAGDMIEVSVSDSGPGVPPDRRNELFAPFTTAKADGMGVGLSICRTIVEAHGGRIWIDDSHLGGAAFRFTVPAGR